MSRIYIVEDSDIVRESVAEFVAMLPDIEVVGATDTAEKALEQLAEVKADLVLVDMALPGMNGADLIREIKKHWPHVPCLVLSGHGEATYVERAVAAGARGYVMKGAPMELPDAIQQVLSGRPYFSSSLPRAILPGEPGA